MSAVTRFVMRADAVFDGVFGVLLLLSPWLGGLFRLLDLPNPQPGIFTQFCGGLLIVCAYLLWIASTDLGLARPVALSIGLVNAAGVLVVAGWLLSGQLGIGMLGTAMLALSAVLLVVFSFFELRYAFRS